MENIIIMHLSIVLDIFIQNYFIIFNFLLIWDKNLGSHTGWLVAKPLWICP